MSAFVTPDFCSFPPLVKKLTVSGIIGKTQGVSKANKPPKNPAIKIHNQLLCSVCASTLQAFFAVLQSKLAGGSTDCFIETESTVANTFFVESLIVNCALLIVLPSKVIANFSGPNGMQPTSSLQTCPSNSPLKTAFEFLIFTFCINVTSPSNEVTSTPNKSSNLVCFFPTSSAFPTNSMSLFFSKRNSVGKGPPSLVN